MGRARIGNHNRGDGERVNEWVERIMTGMTVKERVVFMTGCWALWERRNKKVFDHEVRRDGEVIDRIRRLVQEMEVENSPANNMGMNSNDKRGW